jgi:hypothetical protein
MASRGVPRTHTEKQALKAKTKKAERQLPQIEGRRRDFVNDIEFNNAATGGHADEPIPTAPNSRSAIADAKRAAAKGAGVMSLSKKIDPEIDIAGVRATQDHLSARIDGTKTSRGARSVDKSLDKGAVRTARDGGAAPVRRTKSNAEIADGVATTARKSPAPRAAPLRSGETLGAAGGEPSRMDKRTGGTRQRVPAPGNVVSVPKGELISGRPESKVTGLRSTSSSGGAKPPKRPAHAGKGGGAAKSKGADMGLEE